MRVVIVSQYFWPENFRINDVALELKARGHEVTVYTGLPNYPQGDFAPGYSWFGPFRENWRGVDIIRTPLIPRRRGRAIHLALNYLSFAGLASVLAPFRIRGKVDALFVFEPSPITVGLPAIVLRWVKRAPLLFWVQDLWPESLAATGAVKNPRILGGVSRLVEWIYRRCDLVLVQSEGFSKSVIDQGADPDHVRYFPNFAESLYGPRKLEGRDPLGELGVPTGFRLLFAGNIGAAQDFPTLLAAAELLRDRPDVHFVIVGDGREKQQVLTEVARRGLHANFHLVGSFPPDRMPEFFAAADALVVSLRDEPAFALTLPSKVQSYLACGKPLLGSIRGEAAEVIEKSGSGFCAPPESPGEFAAAVRSLAQLPTEERKKMGERGLDFFRKNYDKRELMDRLEGWMNSCR